MNLLHSYYEEAKHATIKELNLLKHQKFSATVDEWTSFGNNRYLSVNLHTNSSCGNTFNLGLIRIVKRCPAHEMKKLFIGKLKEFQLCETDVVACTSDGASVCVKFGTLIISTHQQSLNHGIHLAVVDVLVKKNSKRNMVVHNTDTDADSDGSADSDDGENEYASDISDFDEGNNTNSDSDCDFEDAAYVMIELQPDIHAALVKVRKIVRIFKNSPVKNSFPQEHVRKEHGKDLKMLLDVKTRWNSTETMLQRFMFLYESSCKPALLELNHDNDLLNAAELQLLRDLLQCLQPIKLAITELSKRDCDLLKSEGKYTTDSSYNTYVDVRLAHDVFMTNSHVYMSLYTFRHTEILIECSESAK